MLGSVALILLLIAGYLHMSFWWLVPGTIINSFIGRYAAGAGLLVPCTTPLQWGRVWEMSKSVYQHL